MGEKVDFPNQYQRLMWQGKKALTEENYLKAVQKFGVAYKMQHSFEGNRLYVESLSRVNDFAKGIRIAEEYFDDYLNSPTSFLQYFHLLLLDHKFLRARKYMRLGRRIAALPSDELQEAWVELDQLESIQHLILPEAVGQKKCLLKRMEDSKQPVRPGEWELLTSEITYWEFNSLMMDYLPTAENPFLRPRIVEELVKLGCDLLIPVKGLNGEVHRVQPNLLQPPEKSPALKRMVQYVEEAIGNLDPILTEAIVSEIQGHYALAFPFTPQDESPVSWAQSYLLDYQSMLPSLPEIEETDRIRGIQEIKQGYRELLLQFG